MKITFLGTNGWYDTDGSHTLCVTVETADAFIILDAGSGLFQMTPDAAKEKPAFLLLSHFHMDHIYGLHGLSKARFPGGLTIMGQKGTEDIIRSIVASPFTVPLENLPYPVKIRELDHMENDLPFDLEYLLMDHSDPCLGYRITDNAGTVTFCTDTGYCENAVKLATDADLLITECSFLPGETGSDWPHLNPETAARIALESGAKRLILSHFDASRYKRHELRAQSEAAARAVFPDTEASYDGMVVEV